MKKNTGHYPAAAVNGAGSSVVPHAGSTVLLRTVQTVGLTTALGEALTPWRKPLARHDPGRRSLTNTGPPPKFNGTRDNLPTRRTTHFPA